MKVLDVIVLLLLIGVLGFGVYVLLQYLPLGGTQYQAYNANFSSEISGNYQFYANMRYPDRVISYTIEDACSEKKKEDVIMAFGILQEKTVLSFYQSGNGMIRILCSSIAPQPEDAGHFIAGEGGPTEIINTSIYSVILSGKVSLYREEKCGTPNVAIHEILHALGFDHNNDKKSIMYPVTECVQEIDDYIVEEIDKLYRADSLPDLLISKLEANKTGRYLNFEIIVGNYGFKESNGAALVVSAGGENIKEIDLGKVPIGTRKMLSVQNLRLPRDSQIILFKVETSEKELSKENNAAELNLE